MKLQPLVSWWLLIGYLVVAVGLIGWQTWQYRAALKQKQFGKLKSWYRHIALLLLPLIIALGISVQGGVSSPGVSNLDVYFALDVTPSMGATDYNNGEQRIKGAKNDILQLAQKLKGAQMEIIAFDNTANTILPLTNDSSAISAAVADISPQSSNLSRGSSIDEPLQLLSSELATDENTNPQRIRVVFYLGDGEQTSNQKVKSFGPLAKYVSAGAVLGYGTTKGAHMVKYQPFTGSSGKPSYITTIDTTGSSQLVPAISKMDPGALKTIAKQIHVTYFDRDSGGSIDNVYQKSNAALAVDRSHRVIHYFNLYWLFALPLVALLFWDWQRILFKYVQMWQRRKDTRG